MPKFCSNGHQMEDVWEMCPYCQHTAFQRLVPARPAKASLDLGAKLADITSAMSPRRPTMLISEHRRPAVVGWLVALSGEQKGEDFRLREGENTIGATPDCQVTLRNGSVAARHAALSTENGSFFLTDLASTKGTYLNDGPRRIVREELKDDDIIRVGDVVLKFKSL